jgi:hypothetical protein
LVNLTKSTLDKGKRNLSFWRVQLKYNFQRIKWFPHPVHRIGARDNFEFDNDGMNTKKVFDTEMVSEIGYIVRNKRFRNYEYALAQEYAFSLNDKLAEGDITLNKEKLWDLGYFTQWGDKYKRSSVSLPTDQMILDHWCIFR